MDLSGGKSWGELFDYLTATLEVDYNGGISSLSEIRGLSDNADGDVRKAAYEAEIASYRKIKDSIAFALNNIKAQVNLEAKLRGYKNPLEMTLEQSWMQKETLDAMFLAMRESLPHFHRYLKHKAKLLGYEGGLPWFELAAPMGNTENLRFTVSEVKNWLSSKPSFRTVPRPLQTFTPDSCLKTKYSAAVPISATTTSHTPLAASSPEDFTRSIWRKARNLSRNTARY